MQRIGDVIYTKTKSKKRVKKHKEEKKLKQCRGLRKKIENSPTKSIRSEAILGGLAYTELIAQNKLKNIEPKNVLMKYKKIPHENLKAIIMGYIINADNDYITKEEISRKYCVKEHCVENVFRELNREGILSQRHARFAHDTNRNRMFSGSESGWASDIYYIKINQKGENKDEIK
ncbi:hypothetical protein [Clostridium disporicum]|uniref:hypothetical protein n=1 Tax=Clostridium disporicum TaxID=84024 RepID=UPI0034A15C50